MISGKLWLFKHHWKYPFQTSFVFIGAIIEPLLFVYPSIIIGNIIQNLFGGGGFNEITSQVGLLLILAIIQAFLFFLLSIVNEVLAHRVTTDITEELFVSLQYRSLTYHDKLDIGQIMARATGDTRTINIGLSPGYRVLVAFISIWGGALFLTFYVNFYLGLIGTIFLFITLLAILKFGKDILPLSQEVLADYSDLTSLMNDSFAGIREIKSFVTERWIQDSIAEASKKHMRSKIKEGDKNVFFYPSLIVNIYAIGTITAAFYLSALYPNLIQLGTVISLTGYLIIVRAMSNEIQWVIWYAIASVASVGRLHTTIFDEDQGKFTAGTVTFDGSQAELEFRNVSFKYSKDRPLVLKNLNLKLSDKQTMVIIGGPGSGKSTLTKLIQRLYLPTSGELLLNGHPLQDYTNESLRKHVATIEQDVFLFNTTVLENIRFGKPTATLEEVIEVAKIAQAHEFIHELPNSYETIIGEGGIRLSGGQKQRLSIARALLINPSILIIDDGASALDAKTEIQIQTAISDVLKTRTTIITTHRLSIIARADLVVMLEKGEIVGTGTHEELIRRNFYYRRLFSSHYELPEVIAD